MADKRLDGLAVFQVGGAVRDRLLGETSPDRDYVVVGATPELMKARGFRPVGRDFPVFLHPETHEEYALARTERKQGRGYHGFVFHAGPEVGLEEDLARRDLTINAMALSPDGELIDPYLGRLDLAQGTLRHVSDAFREDPVRILRLARFATRFQAFRIDPDTEALCRQMVASGEVAHLVPERVWQEMVKALHCQRPSRFIDVLRRVGALTVVMPELASVFADQVSSTRSGPADNTGQFCLAALDRAAEMEAGLEARFAALLHRLDQEAIHALTDRLAVPKEARAIASAVAACHELILDRANGEAEGTMATLEHLDALRRPERLAQVLAACDAIGSSRSGLSMQAACSEEPPSAYWLKAAEVVSEVSTQALIQKGLAGPVLGQTLRQARIDRLGHWLRGT